MKLTISTLIFVAALRVFSSDSPKLFVEWYKPELDHKTTLLDKSRLILSGQTVSGAVIRLASDQVLLITEKDEIESISSSEVFPKEVVVADEQGFFNIELELPFKTVQLPFEVKAIDGQSKIYQLNLSVAKDAVKVANSLLKSSPYGRKAWSLWGGLGFNYLSYNQESNIPSNLTFQNYSLPTLFAKVSRNYSQEWTVQGTVRYSMGKTSSSNEVRLSDGKYQWMLAAVDAIKFNPKWELNIGKYPAQFGLQGGIQYHLVPFITRDSTTDAFSASVVTNQMVIASMGGICNIQFGRYWLGEAFLRYQLPLITGSLFKVIPQVAFDGSLGAVYKNSSQSRLGIFWNGQYQKYGFSNHEDAYSSAHGGGNLSGSQTLLFSNIEFKYGYEFN